MKHLAVLALLLLWPLLEQQAQAQAVGLVGMLGGNALLIVDGAAPKAVAAGDSYKAVKVISTRGDTAVLEAGGKRLNLRVGDAPASVGSGGGHVGDGSGGTRVVLSAGSGGHFMSQGQINGQSVHMVVDTGASLVSLSAQEAQRLGLNYQAGQMVQMSTANGVIPAWRIKLAALRVGDVLVYDVDSVVSSGAMPYVLLGNSFLARFQMTRNNDQMVLEKRY
jgi:aspartyl protease family protein